MQSINLGYLESYRSLDPCDKIFSSIGKWGDIEEKVEGGAGNLLYRRGLIPK